MASDESTPITEDAPGEGRETSPAPVAAAPPELLEREAAWRRGETNDRERAAGHAPPRDAATGRARATVMARAFAALAENVRDYAIFLMDPQGVITFWGEGARLIKWWTKAQAEGAHLRLLYPPGGSEDGTAESHLREAMERGEYTGEGQRVRSDGSTFWAGVTLTALRNDDGTLLGFAKVTRDLTARRAADALLQSAAESAETANRAKSGFLAMMSHEIRTPVNAILGYHELLEREIGGPLTPEQRGFLARASAGGQHLLTLIGDVLDFSRLEAGQATVARGVVRVGDAVEAAFSLVAPQAAERGVVLTDAVSGYAAGLAAWGDEAGVRQILVNLLANAVKFTVPRHGEPGQITVSAGAVTRPSPDVPLSGVGPWIYVRVEDTGPGIPADQLESVFQAFVQGDMALTREAGGTGLGLAISRRLARLMHGDVTARSTVGVGSTFFLWLPAAPTESLHTGGLEGHGPGTEGAERDDRTGGVAPPVGPLREVADAILAELERVLRTYVARLRTDSETPRAHAMDEAQLEDHMASFLADLAGTIATLDVPAGEPGPALRDGTAIQQVIAVRHGAQRARLEWAESEVRREFVVLREELAAAVRRQASGRLRGPTVGIRQADAERALELLDHFLTIAERVSVASYHELGGSTQVP